MQKHIIRPFRIERVRAALVTGSILLPLSVGGGGCGIVPAQPQPLTADSFVQRRAPRTNDGPIDKAQPRLYDQVHYDLLPSEPANPNDAPLHPNQQGISKTVRDSVRPLADDATQPTTMPAVAPGQITIISPPAAASTRPDSGSSIGQAWTVGSVLANVNDTPIYADKVLSTLDRPLRAEARKETEPAFRRVAADLINRQLMEFIHAELEFAAAQRNLESKDEQIARGETTLWRQRMIAMAGGSTEVARRRALEDGTDFEEACRQHYRLIMTQLYYQRKVFPLIQVSASDLRSYYDQHRLSDFTKPAEAKFSVIKVSVAATGSRAQAMDKIRRISERLKGGAEFSTLAGETNDDKVLQTNKGDVRPGGWMEKGAYRIEKVEDAVWKLQPGQVTDPIDDGSAIYLARLVERRGGTTQPFEEQSVQDRIRETLRKQQFNTLRENVRAELQKQAIISFNPDMMQTALDMVMQRYPRWVGASAQ